MKICFVAHYAYRALTGQGSGHIGGVERQISMMAKWLASRGHDVSVVVWSEGQDNTLVVDGVRILGVCRKDAGVPGLRFFIPRWTSLRRALASADADIYYHNCAEYITGQVAMWARGHSRKFVYSVASDPECDPHLGILKSYRERLLYRYGLTRADAVVAQTTHQRKMLEQGFDVESTVLSMPCDVPDIAESEAAKTARKRVLWIGRIDPVKRAEVMLAAAQSCPEIKFDFVGPDGTDPDYVRRIRADAARLPNVSMRGAVNFTDVWHYYRNAAVLCCTSRFEGFPNTFIEAWSQGVPVVSTVDPDDVIRHKSLGAVIGEPEECGSVLSEFLADRNTLDECSVNAHRYFLDNFEKDRAMRRFEAFFDNIVEQE